jgi:hypothetical protein
MLRQARCTGEALNATPDIVVFPKVTTRRPGMCSPGSTPYSTGYNTSITDAVLRIWGSNLLQKPPKTDDLIRSRAGFPEGPRSNKMHRNDLQPRPSQIQRILRSLLPLVSLFWGWAVMVQIDTLGI